MSYLIHHSNFKLLLQKVQKVCRKMSFNDSPEAESS